MPNAPLSRSVIRDAVQLACRAPSLHNSQPWRWVAGSGELDLFLDQDRMVDTDQSGREALISCGAALDHFRVAMAAAGWTANITRLPDPADVTHLASVDFVPRDSVTDADYARAEAIGSRRTDRLPFGSLQDDTALPTLLHKVARGDQVRLDLIADDARSQLAQASQLTDAVRMYDSAYHAELAWWTGPFSKSDGIPPSSLVSASESDRVDIARNFPVGDQQDRRAELQEDHSRVVVLSTSDEHRQSVLFGGESLSALLLECTVAGLATCTLTHIVEVPASRDIISSLVAQPFPQALIRVGAASHPGEQPERTPRRPIEDVLQFAS